MLNAFELDFGSPILSEEDPVSCRDVQWTPLTFVPLSWANSYDASLKRLLLRGVWDDDPTCGLLLLINALDEETIIKRCYGHELLSLNFFDNRLRRRS